MFKSKEIYCHVLIFVNFVLISPQVLSDSCEPGRQMSLGSNHKPITQHKIDIGQGLHVKGIILSASDCSPVENARIEHWQANSKGKYVDELRAYLLSGTGGEFNFETEWPALTVPHIHFIVQAEGHKKLITLWRGDEIVETITLEFVLEALQE